MFSLGLDIETSKVALALTGVGTPVLYSKNHLLMPCAF